MNSVKLTIFLWLKKSKNNPILLIKNNLQIYFKGRDNLNASKDLKLKARKT